MRDGPAPPALLDMIAELLRTVVIPEVAGTTAYQTRIAANLLDMLAREWRNGGSDDDAERIGLAALLGDDCDGDLAALNKELATRLRERRITLEDSGVAEHLWAATLAKLAVDQPKYARYRALALDQPSSFASGQ